MKNNCGTWIVVGLGLLAGLSAVAQGGKAGDAAQPGWTRIQNSTNTAKSAQPRRSTGGFGGPVELKPEDKPAFDDPPTGIEKPRVPLTTNSISAPSRDRGARGGISRPADRPAPRNDRNSQFAHEKLVAKAKRGGIDVYFVGDSITRRWGATDYPELLAHWTTNFFGWNAGNFGWGADLIENMLWRLENGELDGVNPKIIVVLAGINNVGTVPGDDEKVENITRGLKAIVRVCQEKAPNAVVVLTGLFPRNDNMAVIPEINQINDNLARMADGTKVRYLNVNDKLADKGGRLFEGISKDRLHLTVKGYQVWADGLKPIFTEILGLPALTDHAPPPTGDPSAKPRKAAASPNPATP